LKKVLLIIQWLCFSRGVLHINMCVCVDHKKHAVCVCVDHIKHVCMCMCRPYKHVCVCVDHIKHAVCVCVDHIKHVCMCMCKPYKTCVCVDHIKHVCMCMCRPYKTCCVCVCGLNVLIIYWHLYYCICFHSSGED
jgi:hypothetical protein